MESVRALVIWSVPGRAALLFLGALVIVLWHGALSGPWFPLDHYVLPGPGTSWSDALAYHAAAGDLVDGMGLRENAWPVTLRAPRAPGYIGFLALVYGWGLGATGLWLVQSVLHAATVALTYRFAARAAGETAGILAAASLALYRPALDLAQLPMSETLFAFLGALALHLLARGAPLPGGLAIGLATTVRSVALPFALGAAAVLAWRRQRRAAALVLVGAALPVLVLCARNAVSAGTFSPAATYHVWTSWAEFTPPRPDSDDAHFAAFVPLRDRPEAELQRTFRRAFVARVLEDPQAYLARAYQLARSSLRLPEEQPVGLSDLVALPLLCALVLGLARARDRAAVVLIALLPASAILASAALGEGAGRFRMPVDFALFALAAGGLAGLLRLREPALVPPAWPGWSRRLPAAGAAALAVVIAVPALRIAAASPPPALPVPPGLSFAEYAARVGAPELEGRSVRWAGVLEALVHLQADQADPRSAVFGKRPYPRVIGQLLADGPAGPADGQRVWVELPDPVGAGLPFGERLRVVVAGRVETILDNPSRHRARIVVTELERPPRGSSR